MARRSAKALDLAIAAAIVGLVVAGLSKPDPPLPHDVCESPDGSPRYDALAADGITIAAVFGQMIHDQPLADDDPAWLSARAFGRALSARGFVANGTTYRRGAVTIDVTVLADDPTAIDAAIDAAIATHDIIYYDGHEYDGTLTPDPPVGSYRIIVLDSCWTTQRYAKRLLAPNVDVITNTQRAVTGSVQSFVSFLDGIDARATWRQLLGPMNDLATRRAESRRRNLSRLRDPEHYRHDAACSHKG
jgi:hypothetical protein